MPYCPMKFNYITMDVGGGLKTDTCQCEYDKCAWWDINTSKCSITSSAPIINRPDPTQELLRRNS